MRESWLYYGYIRRWGLFLLLGLGLGALAGFGYYLQRDAPTEFTAHANFFAVDYDFRVTYTLASTDTLASTEKAAVEELVKLALLLELHTNRRFELRNIAVEGRRIKTIWWKTTLLGSVIGALLSIGAIFLWEDARA